MATTSKKKGDKKGSKKAEEAAISVQESKDSIPIETEQPTPCPETPAPVNLTPEQPPEPEIPPPEIVYEEPILTKLIVERYARYSSISYVNLQLWKKTVFYFINCTVTSMFSRFTMQVRGLNE